MPDQFREYRKANPNCELHWCDYMPCRSKVATDINHIFRRQSNEITNIIHLSRPAHDWFHAYPADGRIMCLLVKARKGELDPQGLFRASGMYPLGWLEKAEPRLDWIGPYRDELHERLVELSK